MSKKNNLNKFVQQDHDETFFCGKCGRAGFKNQSSVLGHLAHCKGFKHEQKEAISVLKNLKKVETGHLDLENNLTEDEKDSSSSVELNPLNSEASRPTSWPTPRPTPRPTPQGLPLNGFSDSAVSKLRVENAELRNAVSRLEKFVFNHSAHVQPQRSSFSSPSDMMGNILGEVYQIPLVRILLAFGAIAMVYSFVCEQVDKASNKGKNSRK